MNDTKNLRGRSVSAVAWSALHGWGSQLIGLIVFSVLARLLQPADFGLIAMAAAFIAIAGIFMDQGLSHALIQRSTIDPEHCDTAFWMNAACGVGLFILGQAIAPLVADFYSEPELTPVLRVLSLVLLIRSGASVQTALLQRDLDYKTLAFRNFLALVTSGSVGVGMAISGYGVWSLVGQQLTNAVVLSITLWVMSSWKPSMRFSRKHFTDLYKFGLNVLGANITGMIGNQADKVIIGSALGVTALGYYAIASRLLEIMISLLAGVTSAVALPIFSTLQNDLVRLRNAFMTALRLSAFIAYPFFFGVAALAPVLLPTLLNPKWEDSVVVVQILCLYGLLSSSLYFHGNLMMALGKPHWRLAISSGTAALKIGAYLLVVSHGIEAIALATVVCAYAVAPVTVFLVHKLVKLEWRLYFTAIAQPLAASLIMGVSVYLASIKLETTLSPLPLLAITVSSGVIIYAGAAFILSPATSRELVTMFARFLPKGRRTAS